MIEHGLIPALDDMLEGNTSFYFDPKTCYEFLYAVCVQYFRTKRMRAAIGAVNSPFPGSDMNRVRNLFTLISAMRVADSLFQERTEHKIVILKKKRLSPSSRVINPSSISMPRAGKALPKSSNSTIRSHPRER
jgi:hypothetical protein